MSLTKQRIKDVANEAIEQIAQGIKPNLYQIQKNHGYSDSSARSYKVTTTKVWKEIIDRVDDNDVINRFVDILKEGKDEHSIKAGVELMKLKNRYPTRTSASLTIRKTIDSLKE